MSDSHFDMQLKVSQIVTNHRGPVTSIHISDNLCLSGSADGTVAITEMGTPFKHKGRLYGHMNRGISAIDYDPRLQHVLIGADDGACLVNLTTNSKI